MRRDHAAKLAEAADRSLLTIRLAIEAEADGGRALTRARSGGQGSAGAGGGGGGAPGRRGCG